MMLFHALKCINSCLIVQICSHGRAMFTGIAMKFQLMHEYELKALLEIIIKDF